MFGTIRDAYRHFEELHGGETPVRSLEELREAICQYGLRYEEIAQPFWDAVFEGGWANGETDELPPELGPAQ